ncbi:MAG: hypothetical protein K6G61_03275 [Solobacterium sp.]|nr:hypothetical protein [Solobacterium sp.]
MNLSTFIIFSIICVITVLDIRYLLKNGIDTCSGNCNGCGSQCKWVNDIKKAKRKIERQKKLKKLFGITS